MFQLLMYLLVLVVIVVVVFWAVDYFPVPEPLNRLIKFIAIIITAIILIMLLLNLAGVSTPGLRLE